MTQPDFWSVVRPEPAPSPVARERERLNAAARRIVEYMTARKGQWVRNSEICDPAVGGNRGIGARLPEIRKDGWVIEKRHCKDGWWEYRLLGRKDQV